MATERLVSAAAYGDRRDKSLSRVLHHDQGHDLATIGITRDSSLPAPKLRQSIHPPAILLNVQFYAAGNSERRLAQRRPVSRPPSQCSSGA